MSNVGMRAIEKGRKAGHPLHLLFSSPLLPFSPAPRRRGFTLLEVILALALTVVVLGLVGLGIHVQLAVATTSRDQVEEAQLARVLLQRIADDLRNAIPFQPPQSSSSSSSSSSGTAGQAGSSGASGMAGSSGSSGTSSNSSDSSSSTAPLSGGIFGTTQAIQIETTRRPKATLASLQVAGSDPTQPARLSDIRVITYSLGAPVSVDLSQQSPPSVSGAGLYRHEQDRAEFFYGTQNGQTDESDPATELLAPEVVDFHVTYYGGTGGTSSTSASSGTSGSGTSSSGTSSNGTSSGETASNGTTSGGTSTADTTTNGTTTEIQWDSTQSGMLPAAVRISISLRHQSPKSIFSFAESEKRPPAVYSLLVYLPNSTVDTSLASQLETPPASTPYQADPAASSGKAGGKAGGKTGGKAGGKGEKGKGEKGKGEKGKGEKGKGEKGKGKKGRGEKVQERAKARAKERVKRKAKERANAAKGRRVEASVVKASVVKVNADAVGAAADLAVDAAAADAAGVAADKAEGRAADSAAAEPEADLAVADVAEADSAVAAPVEAGSVEAGSVEAGSVEADAVAADPAAVGPAVADLAAADLAAAGSECTVVIVSFPRSAWQRTGWLLRGLVTEMQTRSVRRVRDDAERRHEIRSLGRNKLAQFRHG